MNILVVDDDREIVDSICIFLTGEGYKAFLIFQKYRAEMMTCFSKNWM